jgi:SDR family mycofactocin-dependent oxidoreductase
MTELADRVALVTGGACGQGRAHAVALAAAGATVVVCDIADQVPTVRHPMSTTADLDETVRTIGDAGGQARGVVVDVRDSGQVRHLVDDVVARHGRLDILVANAGICGFSTVADLGDDAWHDMIETNLSGAFYCIRAALPHMRRPRFGRIVAISSGTGRMGTRNLGHYTASKWGLIGLVKTVALETATDGITANVICPTTVATPMVLNDATYAVFCPDLDHPTLDDALPRLRAMSPMREPWIEPEDVSRAVLYLVTDPGRTSGSVLEVNLATSASRI